jgi:hypothetical protein
MEKSKNLDDKTRLSVVKEELDRFQKLIAGHRKLLEAIAEM